MRVDRAALLLPGLVDVCECETTRPAAPSVVDGGTTTTIHERARKMADCGRHGQAGHQVVCAWRNCNGISTRTWPENKWGAVYASLGQRKQQQNGGGGWVDFAIRWTELVDGSLSIREYLQLVSL